ncbi:MAG: altronate dehydratase [Bacteroidaceae bacterium]|nr:altronate dehydratase [Bacteroidaceae bacterium]
MTSILRINPSDTVAVALRDLQAGQVVSCDDLTITLLNDIPFGHKLALTDIAPNATVIKYGYPIGHAVEQIPKGALVNHINIRTNLETSSRLETLRQPLPSLLGGGGGGSLVSGTLVSGSYISAYLRPDGQAGLRNDIWIIPTVGCVNGICQQIAERANKTISNVKEQEVGIFHFTHNYGCSQLGDDHENTRKILRNMVRHPNAGGVLVVGLGCENNQPEAFRELCGDYDSERVRFLTCQQVAGSEVEAGVALVSELYVHALNLKRQELPISMLRVGLKCGGSDGLSGITANPLVGLFSDWLCHHGGTTMLTEVPEMFGAEHILISRAATPEIAEQTNNLITDFKQYFISHGQPVGENPSPGNKAGGISTLEEKALGCTQKSGSSLVQGVLQYGETLRPDSSGLHLLCAPGNDLVASTALAAAGCQLILFTTGRGTPFASFVPTMKIATNTDIYTRKPHWFDFNAGSILSDDKPFTELLSELISRIINVANGSQTSAERANIHDIAIWKDGVTL